MIGTQGKNSRSMKTQINDTCACRQSECSYVWWLIYFLIVKIGLSDFQPFSFNADRLIVVCEFIVRSTILYTRLNHIHDAIAQPSWARPYQAYAKQTVHILAHSVAWALRQKIVLCRYWNICVCFHANLVARNKCR